MSVWRSSANLISPGGIRNIPPDVPRGVEPRWRFAGSAFATSHALAEADPAQVLVTATIKRFNGFTQVLVMKYGLAGSPRSGRPPPRVRICQNGFSTQNGKHQRRPSRSPHCPRLHSHQFRSPVDRSHRCINPKHSSQRFQGEHRARSQIDGS